MTRRWINIGLIKRGSTGLGKWPRNICTHCSQKLGVKNGWWSPPSRLLLTTASASLCRTLYFNWLQPLLLLCTRTSQLTLTIAYTIILSYHLHQIPKFSLVTSSYWMSCSSSLSDSVYRLQRVASLVWRCQLGLAGNFYLTELESGAPLSSFHEEVLYKLLNDSKPILYSVWYSGLSTERLLVRIFFESSASHNTLLANSTIIRGPP